MRTKQFFTAAAVGFVSAIAAGFLISLFGIVLPPFVGIAVGAIGYLIGFYIAVTVMGVQNDKRISREFSAMSAALNKTFPRR